MAWPQRATPFKPKVIGEEVEKGKDEGEKDGIVNGWLARHEIKPVQQPGRQEQEGKQNESGEHTQTEPGQLSDVDSGRT